MNKYFGAVVLFVLPVFGCNPAASSVEVPDSWVALKAGKAFVFRAPPDLIEKPVRGKDSFVGAYESPSQELSFDYGMYSDPLEREGYQDWTFRNTTIDGKRAKIGWSEDQVAVHFPKVKGNDKLSMFARLKQPEAKESAEIILQSIDFP